VSKHVVKLKVEIIKAYGVVCMTEVSKVEIINTLTEDDANKSNNIFII
jgi:hypothetical protein